jgi:hypothetical protein
MPFGRVTIGTILGLLGSRQRCGSDRRRLAGLENVHGRLTVLGNGGDDSANVIVRLDPQRHFAEQRHALDGLADLGIVGLADCGPCRNNYVKNTALRFLVSTA